MNEYVLQAIQDERDRQDVKWGAQRDLTQKTWLTILMEEVGEVAESILEGDPEVYRKELVQVAAVAVAALEGYYSPPPPVNRNDYLKPPPSKDPGSG